MTAPRRIVHGTELSGHTHRVVNFLGLLGLPYELIARLEALPGFRAMPVAPIRDPAGGAR